MSEAFRAALRRVDRLGLDPTSALQLHVLLSVKQLIDEKGEQYFRDRTYDQLIDELLTPQTLP